ncbi:DUF4349 domain-containing protein [Mucilaginibacter paludis]|uniref:DUF4349 domain-containing protein n=1 Tax=Mucilaginibacter paludis DSM 18603 TaxID=714943 RepID=H1YDD3_9SPHI|nr:DUF4349 domain-containing protein [Mucilaginibacter paludis]EHQ27159.1 hypothetical protein Mucpa_3055 [Mucilaginibacter paludis DSM 18603]
MKTTALTIMIALMLSACGNQKSKNVVSFPEPLMSADKDVAKYDMAAEKAVGGSVGNTAVKITDVRLTAPPTQQSPGIDTVKKIIKEGDIQFEAGDLSKTRGLIINAVNKAGGYVAEDNQSKDENTGRKEYVLKARIPSKNFDSVLDAISGTADRIDSKNVRVRDVTTEYIDIRSRLDNKRKLEGRYLALLNKAGKMEDILQIENKLTEIRSDIESTQGQLNYMNKQVAYSSLDITFYSKSIVVNNGDGFVYKFKSALSGGWDFLQGLFFSLIGAWPIIILGGILYLALKRYIKLRDAKKASAIRV